MDFETVKALLLAINTYGSTVGETMAAKMISTVLPVVGSVMIVWAIIFAIFEEDLVDGVRKFLETVIIIGVILTTLENWGSVVSTTKEIQEELVAISAPAGGVVNGDLKSILDRFWDITGKFSSNMSKVTSSRINKELEESAATTGEYKTARDKD